MHCHKRNPPRAAAPSAARRLRANSTPRPTACAHPPAPARRRSSYRVFITARCGGGGVLRTLPELSDDELSFYSPSDYWGGEPSLDWIRESQAEKTSFLDGCGL